MRLAKRPVASAVEMGRIIMKTSLLMLWRQRKGLIDARLGGSCAIAVQVRDTGPCVITMLVRDMKLDVRKR